MKKDKPFDTPVSQQQNAPRQTGQSEEHPECCLCGESILPGQPKCFLRDRDQLSTMKPAHSSCQDQKTARERDAQGGKTPKFMG